MAGTSPTQRTLRYIKNKGYTAGVVERFLAFAGKFGRRSDLFGIIDIIAIKDGEILAVQSCGQAFSEHKRKMLAEPKGLEWLNAGGKLVLIGWRKLKLKRGGKAVRWKPRIYHFNKADYLSEMLVDNSQL